MRPSLASQFHAPVLDIWSGLDHYCLGFVGGTTRTIVRRYATMDEAFEAKRAADRAVRQITQKDRAK